MNDENRLVDDLSRAGGRMFPDVRPASARNADTDVGFAQAEYPSVKDKKGLASVNKAWEIQLEKFDDRLQSIHWQSTKQCYEKPDIAFHICSALCP